MNRLQTFQEFLATTSVQVPVLSFVFNLLLAALLSFLLSRIYVRFGTSLSNRKLLAGNFLLITTTTMLIISIVKSSLALSLGLVGALSIVRFRAAIKEPEELAYLFLAIAVGLGLGADQTRITLVAFAVIAVLLMMRSLLIRRAKAGPNLHLIINSHNPQKVQLEQITETLKRHCLAVNLQRFDETKEALEASFLVELEDFEQLSEAKAALRALSDSVSITFLDNRGIG
ncbi:MAG: DUF4956 domain-containing protein [Candidatus Krumholzibacteria bacterium]|nr:DUF4956 domain-containing protein [Candidatus Krumholzibacteria bacterium]